MTRIVIHVDEHGHVVDIDAQYHKSGITPKEVELGKKLVDANRKLILDHFGWTEDGFENTLIEHDLPEGTLKTNLPGGGYTLAT